MTEYNQQYGMKKIKDWVTQKIGKDTIEFTEWFGRELAYDRFSNSQIRNIFGEVKRMEMKGYEETRLLLLKPKLAYAAKRQSGRYAEKAANSLKVLLSSGIDAVVQSSNPKDSFNNFSNIFEAILAYHKANEGLRRPKQSYQRR